MYRFLLTRRWVALALVAVVTAGVCARLGVWQFHQLGDRQDANAVITANVDAAPVPLAQEVPVGSSPSADQEWRRVVVSGRYDAEGQLLVRYQTRGSLRGVDVVVPLTLADGTVVLVDRGFLESAAGTPDAADVPAPPPGRVEVTGWLRSDSDAPDEATTPVDGTVRAVSAATLAETVDGPLRGGWVEALAESPAADGAELAGPERPDTSIGPHLFYGLQWFFFGFLALLGYGWFAYDEAHPARRRRSLDLGAAREDAVEPAELRR